MARFTLFFAAMASVMLAGPATAQSGIDEIIVTMDDTNRTQQNIPASLAVIEDVERIVPLHPAEALNAVAGVNIHRGSGQEHLTAIRSPVLTGGAGAGSFLYLENSVPLRAAGFANVNGLFEAGTEFAETLEVWKGPGPANYGSNAVHGLVNIVPQSTAGGHSVRIMDSDDGAVSGSASLGLGDVRLSASLAHDNGFRADSGFDQQKFQLRVTQQWGAWDVDWLTSFQNLTQETAGFIQGDDAYRDDAVRFTNPNPEAFRDGKSYRTQASFERNIGGNKISLTPYARRAELRFLRHFVPGQALEKNGHSSVGLQSALYLDRDTIGVDIEYTNGFLYEFQANPNRFSFVQGLHYDYEVDSFVAAAYWQRDMDLTDRLALELGARAEYTDYSYDNKASSGTSGRFIRVDDRSDDFFVVTPKASLRYAVSDESNVYLRAARGARAPQVVDLYSVQQNQIAGEADVETLDSLEIGLKYQAEAWLFEAAAFTMWKDNFFFRNANGFNVVNGKTRHTGIEISASAELTDWLTLSGDGTLARHTYDFTETVGSLANNIIAGNRVDTAPDTFATVRATATPIDTTMLELEWRHMGKYFTNPGNTNAYPGHDVFVFRGEAQVSETATLFARVDNLFDTRYSDRADFAFGNERYFPGRPRTFFFGVRAGFE